jgi:hypothetical protein
MELIEKLFIAWVVLCTAILGLSIYNLILGLRNRRDIDRLNGKS